MMTALRYKNSNLWLNREISPPHRKEIFSISFLNQISIEERTITENNKKTFFFEYKFDPIKAKAFLSMEHYCQWLLLLLFLVVIIATCLLATCHLLYFCFVLFSVFITSRFRGNTYMPGLPSQPTSQSASMQECSEPSATTKGTAERNYQQMIATSYKNV